MGLGILLITHRLGEVIGAADWVTVFRDGHVAADVDGEGLTHEKLVEHIVGRPLREAFPPMPAPVSAEPVVEVRHLSVGPLTDVSFKVRPGEVVGIAGLLGSGRSTLMRALFGDVKTTSGEVLIQGRRADISSPRRAMKSGVGFIPEDRAQEAAFADHSVRDNLLAASVTEFWHRLHMSAGREREEAKRLIAAFGIKTSSEKAPLSSLSGGNQQKVMVARWFRRTPHLLLLDEPTQGVDVGARSDIYNLVRRAVDAGAAVLLVVSEFDELASVSDRVLVLRNGRIVGDVCPPRLDAEHLTDLAYAG
jgi:ribose transport system ATP-binding protein